LLQAAIALLQPSIRMLRERGDEPELAQAELDAFIATSGWHAPS
jgi:hypothetical protein